MMAEKSFSKRMDDLWLLGFVSGVEGMDAAWLYLRSSDGNCPEVKQEFRVPISFPDEPPKEDQDD